MTQDSANKRCRESVYVPGRYSDTRCSRPAGHGPGGEYCKQHAKKYEPPPEANGPMIYRVKEEYNGEIKLVSTPTIKETAQFFMIPKEAEKQWGYSARVEKATVSFSRIDAITRYVMEQEGRIENWKKKITEAENSICKAYALTDPTP